MEKKLDKITNGTVNPWHFDRKGTEGKMTSHHHQQPHPGDDGEWRDDDGEQEEKVLNFMNLNKVASLNDTLSLSHTTYISRH